MDSQVVSLPYLHHFGEGSTHAIKVEKIETGIFGLDYPLLLQA